ncbi:MAG: acyl-[acyl-carrier-protein]--UDP-N-acetylglucosamine O-acyltransferase, partial [Deltaproteobacteria bacterium]|nr:acyl-[acyl-carrier-protein]--UDP-N-acetylglucosamine O-acyltransferase [Deltaproteobacteria bacterium]
VAHDSRLGNRCVLVNGVMLGGHSTLGDNVFVGGASTVHQYVRLGEHAYIGGSSAVERDVVPWGLALGNRATLRGPNLLGMKRRGLSKEAIRQGRAAYAELFARGTGTLAETVASMHSRGEWGPVGDAVLSFLAADSRRGVLGVKLDELEALDPDE